MTRDLVEDAEIRYAMVCLKTGVVLELFDSPTPCPALSDLAAAAPELLRASASSDLGALFGRLGSELKSDSFQEIVFMSAERAHVVQRFQQRPDVALLAVSMDRRRLALLLSGVRARMQRLESER